MPAGKFLCRTNGCNKNILLLTFPVLIQNVVNYGVLGGAVYGDFKVSPRLFLMDMDGFFLPVYVTEP